MNVLLSYLRRLPFMILLVCLSLATGALAGDPEEGPDLTIIGDDGERLTLDLHDNMLTVCSSEDGESEVVSVNLASIGAIISETLVEVVDTLSETQLDIHVGQENRIVIADEDQTFELNLDEIITQATEAIQVACEQLDAGEWTVRQRNYDLSDELAEEIDNELEHEIRQLQHEIRRLEKEIRRIETKRVD